MRIALSLAGYFNSQRDASSFGKDAFIYIKQTFLDKYDTDIYIHSWDLESKKEIMSLYGKWIKKAVFEPQKDFKPLFLKNQLNLYPHREGVTEFWNVFSQLYSVQESIKLIEDQYDIIIKSRFDIGRINLSSINNSPYKVQLINFDPKLDINHFYMAEWAQETLDREGPADVWFYSSFDNMKKMASIYEIAANDMYYNSEYSKWCGENDGGPINTAKAWKWVLIKTGLWDKKRLLNIK